MTGNLRLLVEGVLLVVAALFPIVNPVGGAPVFFAMTGDCSPSVRAMLAQRVAINAFLLMLGSMFIGTYVLDFFGLSIPIVQVAGGIVVCAAGWDLLRQDSTSLGAGQVAPSHANAIASRAFYPLTLPLTVGPGSISVAITIGANHPRTVQAALLNGFADAIGALLIAASVFVCYRYADRLQRALGESGTSVVVRLSAFILLCIGVQILWNGASALLGTLPAHPLR
jgi:multiple antibiotic resistance protein